MSALRTVVVGLGAMGQGHARGFASLPELFEVVGGVDVSAEALAKFEAAHAGAKAYTDYDTMLRDAKPDVVALATGPVPRAKMTIAAVEAGVRGVYAEKPMAVGLGEARAMVKACEERGAALVINHQRRMMPVFRTMRRLIAEGAIGRLETVRAACAGDILGDGTHSVDLMRHLTGDAECAWVFGQVYREPPKPGEAAAQGTQPSGGFRYGHAIETGGIAVMGFAGNVRGELYTGEMRSSPYYQDIQAIGSEGRLWRAGDQATVPLLIQDTKSGWRQAPIDEVHEPQALHGGLMQQIFRMFHDSITQGTPHPMSGASALKGHEILSAIHESSRRRAKIALPLAEEHFALQRMIDDGQM